MFENIFNILEIHRALKHDYCSLPNKDNKKNSQIGASKQKLHSHP